MPKLWNKSQCLEFLRKFDAFEHKYLGFNLEEQKGLDREAFISKLKRTWDNAKLQNWNSILNAQSHGIASHNLSYDEEAHAALGIKQVYRDEEHYTNEYLEMLNLVRDKFIYDYTGIDGLCDFFAPAYFEYEWGMHLEIDYGRHDSKYYRDHYVHQIRNLFEMFTLLDDFGYYKKCIDAYSDPESKIGTFIFEAIQGELQSLTDYDRKLYRGALELNGVEKVGNCCEITNEFYKNMHDMMFHYVVYSATIIASIVHDIGYPLSYIRRISGGIGKYLPISQLLASTNIEFGSIEQALQNSLLFNIVPSDKIKKRLNNTEEHGVQSAIVLLMYFCQHGGKLSELQKCAIELAALVIYNHTQKYDVIDKPSDSPELVRSDMRKEPLSHIFRMCDDLQEWDRVYFEITDKSNIMICPECKTPITRHFGTDISKPDEKKYYCCCREKANGVFDTNIFVSRRILNVIGCDNMRVERIGKSNDFPATKFKMHFDCGALLNIMTFSKSFAKVRANGIRNIKKLHSYQGQADTILLDAFVSGNPLVVKIRILKEFASSFGLLFNGDLINAAIAKQGLNRSRNRVAIRIKSIWRLNLRFYIDLYNAAKDFSKECAHRIETALCVDDSGKPLGFNTTNPAVLKGYCDLYGNLIKEFKMLAIKLLRNNSEWDKYFQNDDVLFELACDYLMQQVHVLGYNKVKDLLAEAPDSLKMNGDDVRRHILYRQFYENLYCCDDALCNSVDKYISRDAYDRVKKYCFGRDIGDKPSGVDFFVDYALFIKLWELSQRRYEFFFTEEERDPNRNENKGYRSGMLYSDNGWEDSNLALQCFTQEGNFDNEYRFRVVKYSKDLKKDLAEQPIVGLRLYFENAKPEDRSIGKLFYEVYDNKKGWVEVDTTRVDSGFAEEVKELFESKSQEGFRKWHCINAIE